MMRTPKLIFAAVALSLGGCSSLGGDEGFGSDYYSLARVRPVTVGNGSMVVTPPRPWNRARRQLFIFGEDQRWVEDWTLNGPYLDGISFVTALPSNRSFIRQRRDEDRQVPNFRADMTAPEIAAMIESLYRVRGGAVDFKTLSLQPRMFLG